MLARHGAGWGTALFSEWARSARRVPTVKRRARTLEWRLPGFGSGVPSQNGLVRDRSGPGPYGSIRRD